MKGAQESESVQTLLKGQEDEEALRALVVSGGKVFGQQCSAKRINHMK